MEKQQQPEIWPDLKGQIYLGDEAFVTEMQKRIGKEKDDLNIPKQQKLPIAKPLSEIAAQYSDRNTAILLLTKQAQTASEKSENFINCIQRQLGRLFVSIGHLDYGPDTVLHVTPFCKRMPKWIFFSEVESIHQCVWCLLRCGIAVLKLPSFPSKRK